MILSQHEWIGSGDISHKKDYEVVITPLYSAAFNLKQCNNISKQYQNAFEGPSYQPLLVIGACLLMKLSIIVYYNWKKNEVMQSQHVFIMFLLLFTQINILYT